MRVQLTRPSTGIAYFPGLAAPRVVDTDTLPASDGAEVKRLVAAAELTRRSAATPPRPGAADVGEYVFVLEDEGQAFTCHVTDSEMTAELRALAACLQRLGTPSAG